MLLFGGGCAWLGGLEVLDGLPPQFPLEMEAPTGPVTRPKGRDQVSVDLIRPSEAAAREAWQALEAQARARGFEVTSRRPVRKHEEIRLRGPQGGLALGCCRQRADRQWLVYVTWWP